MRIIFITTVVGILLGLIYWFSRKSSKPLTVNNTCVSCNLCTKACPFDLAPYNAKGTATGFTHSDCLKCEKCVAACPKQSLV
ncbi:4Fe-4S dicluster domain-containing protein [Sporomusa sp.]|uniref:4Fe-4S dicluster domain-containing protein n=1 Tax=Sporomusa sp. TaxID=2078658 RepID=UPI002CFF4222|nr:4Fe-4S dicluster domain-containing protein [Sporomusa sp.]HWR41548.1 4Fe-4S dicluster domain-containing protein [Sporomusa sp.]